MTAALIESDYHKAVERRLLLLLMRAQGLYADVSAELKSADPEDDEYCLLLSNGADDLAAFVSGLERLREERFS